MNIIDPSIKEYCDNHSQNDSIILTNLIKHTINNVEGSAMLSGKVVGNLLQGIICMIQSIKVLEIGMYTGYSALKMAEALPNNGTVDTCELADNHCQTARSFFDKSNVGDKITIHRGEAIKSLEKFSNNSFDLCFIDADKINYLNYYIKSINLVRRSGVVVLDNMLWGGTVLDPQDDNALSICKTGDFIQKDNRCFNFLLPIRDGVMICIKK